MTRTPLNSSNNENPFLDALNPWCKTCVTSEHSFILKSCWTSYFTSNAFICIEILYKKKINLDQNKLNTSTLTKRLHSARQGFSISNVPVEFWTDWLGLEIRYWLVKNSFVCCLFLLNQWNVCIANIRFWSSLKWAISTVLEVVYCIVTRRLLTGFSGG